MESASDYQNNVMNDYYNIMNNNAGAGEWVEKFDKGKGKAYWKNNRTNEKTWKNPFPPLQEANPLIDSNTNNDINIKKRGEKEKRRSEAIPQQQLISRFQEEKLESPKNKNRADEIEIEIGNLSPSLSVENNVIRKSISIDRTVADAKVNTAVAVAANVNIAEHHTEIKWVEKFDKAKGKPYWKNVESNEKTWKNPFNSVTVSESEEKETVVKNGKGSVLTTKRKSTVDDGINSRKSSSKEKKRVSIDSPAMPSRSATIVNVNVNVDVDVKENSSDKHNYSPLSFHTNKNKEDKYEHIREDELRGEEEGSCSDGDHGTHGHSSSSSSTCICIWEQGEVDQFESWGSETLIYWRNKKTEEVIFQKPRGESGPFPTYDDEPTILDMCAIVAHVETKSINAAANAGCLMTRKKGKKGMVRGQDTYSLFGSSQQRYFYLNWSSANNSLWSIVYSETPKGSYVESKTPDCDENDLIPSLQMKKDVEKDKEKQILLSNIEDMYIEPPPKCSIVLYTKDGNATHLTCSTRAACVDWFFAVATAIRLQQVPSSEFPQPPSLSPIQSSSPGFSATASTSKMPLQVSLRSVYWITERRRNPVDVDVQTEAFDSSLVATSIGEGTSNTRFGRKGIFKTLLSFTKKGSIRNPSHEISEKSDTEKVKLTARIVEDTETAEFDELDVVDENDSTTSTHEKIGNRSNASPSDKDSASKKSRHRLSSLFNNSNSNSNKVNGGIERERSGNKDAQMHIPVPVKPVKVYGMRVIDTLLSQDRDHSLMQSQNIDNTDRTSRSLPRSMATVYRPNGGMHQGKGKGSAERMRATDNTALTSAYKRFTAQWIKSGDDTPRSNHELSPSTSSLSSSANFLRSKQSHTTSSDTFSFADIYESEASVISSHPPFEPLSRSPHAEFQLPARRKTAKAPSRADISKSSQSQSSSPTQPPLAIPSDHSDFRGGGRSISISGGSYRNNESNYIRNYNERDDKHFSPNHIHSPHSSAPPLVPTSPVLSMTGIYSEQPSPFSFKSSQQQPQPSKPPPQKRQLFNAIKSSSSTPLTQIKSLSGAIYDDTGASGICVPDWVKVRQVEKSLLVMHADHALLLTLASFPHYDLLVIKGRGKGRGKERRNEMETERGGRKEGGRMWSNEDEIDTVDLRDISAVEIDDNNTGLFRLFIEPNPPPSLQGAQSSVRVSTNTVFGWCIFMHKVPLSSFAFTNHNDNDSSPTVEQFLHKMVRMRKQRQQGGGRNRHLLNGNGEGTDMGIVSNLLLSPESIRMHQKWFDRSH